MVAFLWKLIKNLFSYNKLCGNSKQTKLVLACMWSSELFLDLLKLKIKMLFVYDVTYILFYFKIRQLFFNFHIIWNYMFKYIKKNWVNHFETFVVDKTLFNLFHHSAN